MYSYITVLGYLSPVLGETNLANKYALVLKIFMHIMADLQKGFVFFGLSVLSSSCKDV